MNNNQREIHFENYFELYNSFYESWKEYVKVIVSLLINIKSLSQKLMTIAHDEDEDEDEKEFHIIFREIQNDLNELKQYSRDIKISPVVLPENYKVDDNVQILHNKIIEPIVRNVMILKKEHIMDIIVNFEQLLSKTGKTEERLEEFVKVIFTAIKKVLEFISQINTKIEVIYTHVESCVHKDEKEALVETVLKEVVPPSDLEKIENVTEIKTGDFNILFVDDDPTMHFWAKRIFTDYNLKVIEIGQRALEEVLLGWPDLILLDINMPGMTGIEFLQHLKNEEFIDVNHLPIIMVTTVSDEQTVKECIDLGAKYFLLKPVIKEKLFDVMSAFLPDL